MSKENIIVCVDNSEFMRNGDYTPTRFDAQQASANLIFRTKTAQNRETLIGILTMAGRSPVVVTSLTNDASKLRASSGQIKVNGFIKFEQSLKIAQLAVKRHGQLGGGKRLIVFVGSPIACEAEVLQTVGKRLRRNNIAIDVVNFGECHANQEKLEALVHAANKSDNSSLLTIPPGPHILSDMIVTSSILQQAPGGGGGGGGGAAVPAQGGIPTGAGQVDFPGGVDPSLDPELAEAMRLSMLEFEEEQKRRREDGDGGEAEAGATPGAGEEDAMMEDDVDDLDDEQLRRAIAMSLEPSGGGGEDDDDDDQMAVDDDDVDDGDDDDLYGDDVDEDEGEDDDLYGDDDDDDDDEDVESRISASLAVDEDMPDDPDDSDDDDDGDAQLAAALRLSMQQPQGENLEDILEDTDFLNECVENLPGVEDDEKKDGDKKDEDEAS